MLIEFEQGRQDILKRRMYRMKYNEEKKVLMEKINRLRENMTDKYDEDDIKAAANEIRGIFNVEDSENFPIVSILNNIGIKTFQKQMKPRELSAYISIDPKYLTMYDTTKIACVNIMDNVGHKRFALVHELAHYIFDYNENKSLTYYNTYRSDEKNDDKKEKRANCFAANILMPEQRFKRSVHECEEFIGKSKPDMIEALSKRFEVSPKAVLLRMRELDIREYCE